MGSFSWMKADKDDNVKMGEKFKFLIPKEFGGGFIVDEYQDYGYLGEKSNGEPKYDMYELLAIWNKELIKYGNLFGKIEALKEIDKHTNNNRGLGIDIGCYDDDIDKLKYPLKLVSVDYAGRYEDLDTPSYRDPDQGCDTSYEDEWDEY